MGKPPFSMLDKVITKAILEPCVMVLVVPEWREYHWWEPLESITVSRVVLPPHSRVYRRDHCPDLLPAPHWNTAVSLIDTTK